MGIKIFFGGKKPKIDDAKKYDHISQAPAFWLAVANSVLKSTNEKELERISLIVKKINELENEISNS